MLRSFKLFSAGAALQLCVSVFCVSACDSGFEKVGDDSPEPEPNPEPSAEPEVEAVDAGQTRAPFVVPDAEFELDDTEVAVAELAASDLADLCDAHQQRLDAIAEYFSEEPSLCFLASVSAAERIATSNATFTARCESVLDQCDADGPSNVLDDHVAPAARSLQCEQWSASSCDISAQSLVTCLEDVVENLNERLNAVGSCDLSRAAAQVAVSRIDELSGTTDAFVLSNRCAGVECLFGSGPSAPSDSSVPDAGD